MNGKVTGREIGKETSIHGTAWDSFHGGYFSDLSVASPLIQKACETIASSQPDVVIDLGGGTGYLLRALQENCSGLAARLVNIDLSGKQLNQSARDYIQTVQCSIESFTRTGIDPHAEKFLFLMRSVLHYMGKHGVRPFLHHLRKQMAKGEFFIHQTACFVREKDARCLNILYENMGTEKWYPSTDELRRLLVQSGWAIISEGEAPPLPLTSDDLRKRYMLSAATVNQICDAIMQQFGEIHNVFQKSPDGFCAYLHYRIFACVAA
jgi:SAM-dependent methyltransferase